MKIIYQLASFSKQHTLQHSRRYFDKKLLPPAITFYQSLFPNIKPNINTAWVNVCCCFHDDKNPSLSLNLTTGGFYCFGCEARGGDLVDFYMQKHGVPFTEAVNHFGAWIYEE